MNQTQPISVAVISLTSTDNVEKNIATAESMVQAAAVRGASWVVLPEMLGFMGPYDKHHDHGVHDADLDKATHKAATAAKTLPRLSKLAQSLKIILFAGTLAERPADNIMGMWQGKEVKKVFNTLYVIGRDGSVLTKYQKIHLFNLTDHLGQPLYCESDGFVPGDSLVSLDIDGFHVGLAICYDLRFPELFRKLARSKPVDTFVIPSAFTLQTGMDHWELLLRARAVENQCYVIASNQTGTHSPGKQSFGHSMVIDPWGHKLCDTGDAVGTATASLTKHRIAEVRGRLPAISNMRNDLY